MSSLQAHSSLLSSATAPARYSRLVDARSAVHARRSWPQVATEAAADWVTVAVTTSGASLVDQCFFAQHELHRLSVTLVQIPFCVAALVVLLLANDGAYRGENGPLSIRHAERSLRAIAQASLLLLLLSVVLGSSFARGTIEISLLALAPLLILEKRAVTLSTATTGARAASAEQTTEKRWAGVFDGLDGAIFPIDAADTRDPRDGATRNAGRGYALAKRIVDLIFAVAAIVATLPLALVVTILIRVDTRGPVLFRQQRVGKDGRLFTIYKFRSMLIEAPQYDDSPHHSSDPRITRIGRFLRARSIDELPQLLNVVKGEMSLVGPRPEMQFLVEQHRAEHLRRLQVTPGMTGLWQLSPARAARIHENPHYDEYYIRHRSLSMDLAILLYTPAALMRGI